MHILEAGYEPEHKDRPCLLLLHGFPELAYSWRKQLLPLARAGYHVVAPDLRGYGRTTGWDGNYDGDVASFSLLNIVRDCLALVFALGRPSVAAVVGHDYGSPVAAYCALVRPDVFQRVVLMSGPFAGPPTLPFGRAAKAEQRQPPVDIQEQLAQLPRPRKHYRWYYSGADANANMHGARQGLTAFFRGYYHGKSADWANNNPHPLAAWTAEELAKLPDYYVMDRDLGMAETVAAQMPAPINHCDWLTDEELAVYVQEYQRNTFQGGLQWYRCGTDANIIRQLQLYAGRTIDVPSCFIAGKADWGIYQTPKALQQMDGRGCSDLRAVHLVEGAGHWVQQEQAGQSNALILSFLGS